MGLVKTEKEEEELRGAVILQCIGVHINTQQDKVSQNFSIPRFLCRCLLFF